MSIDSISSGDPLIQLAVLLVESAELRAELDRHNLNAAREELREASERQIAALHEAADDVRTGAWVEGGLAFTGSAMSVIGTVRAATKPADAANAKVLAQCGEGVSSLAGPLGRLAGEAPRMDSEARAKRADQQAADAAWRRDDAQAHANRVSEHADRILDLVSQVLDDENAGNLAILANS